MISVYYSNEIGPKALLYYKNSMFTWSDYNATRFGFNQWEEDEDPKVQDSPDVHIKLFEMEE